VTKNTAITLAVCAILLTIIGLIAISGYYSLKDMWLSVALVLATSVVELVKAAVEIAKATHKTMLDDEPPPPKDDAP